MTRDVTVTYRKERQNKTTESVDMIRVFGNNKITCRPVAQSSGLISQIKINR